MDYEAHLVNAFTGDGAEGNPAGVVISQKELEPVTMQEISQHLGFSETAFIRPHSKGEGEYHIRWFTTVVEVPLCGHATLAAAAVIFNEHKVKPPLIFHSKSGILTVSRKEGLYVLDFPLDEPFSYKPPEKILAALSLEKYTACVRGKLTEYLLLHVLNESTVAEISPNYPLLKALELPSVQGLIITAISSDSAYDFVSRFFDPWAGIMEDPVTGSAHTLLGPYWQAVLDKEIMTARQISSRGGILYLQIRNRERIDIGGYAQITGKQILSIV